MAYTAGDAIPAGAVLGGHRSLGSHSDLFVVRVLDEAYGSYIFDDNDTSSQLGYVIIKDRDDEWQHMDIMILLWFVDFNVWCAGLFPGGPFPNMD